MSTDAARVAARRLPLLPQRQKTSGPHKSHGAVELQVSDCYYKCAVELAKVVYTRIDNRYTLDDREEKYEIAKKHREKMDTARKILNESRNEVLESVLPMFTIRLREGGEDTCAADTHVHDYIVQNIFEMVNRTFKAYADEFVAQEDVVILERNLDKVFAIQRDRLAGLLLNFVFGFRQVEVKG